MDKSRIRITKRSVIIVELPVLDIVRYAYNKIECRAINNQIVVLISSIPIADRQWND